MKKLRMVETDGAVGRFADLPGWRNLPTVRDDELIYLADLTPRQRARLREMTPAQLRALARRQAEKRQRG